VEDTTVSALARRVRRKKGMHRVEGHTRKRIDLLCFARDA
jgi:hypothetical protein